MARHSSATAREQEPHANRDSRTNTIVSTLKQRAQAVLNDTSIDPQSSAIIRCALECSQTREADQREPSEKIEALAEIICGAGDQSAAALFVLMGTLANSAYPEALANTAKHLAFTRCGELNVYGMVDAQIAVVERELLAETIVS